MKSFQTVVAVSGSRPFGRWPQIRTALWILAVAVSVLCRGVVPACAQESSEKQTSEIAKQAQNPIANVISVPLENDFYPHTGIDKKDSYVFGDETCRSLQIVE